MRTKKFYIPIGALILVICAIAFFALRSDTPKEPIMIIKTVTPTKRSSTPGTPTAEGRTVSASMPKEETIEGTPVSTSEVSEVLMSEILSKYPDYETMDAWNQENVRRWVRKDKILKAKDAKIADLKRQLAVQEAQKELAAYLQSSAEKIDSEYRDVQAFLKRYPDPEIEDFIREYPDETERRAFMLRTLEASKIRKAMAERILETPGAEEYLPSELLSDIIHLASIDIDKIIGGAE